MLKNSKEKNKEEPLSRSAPSALPYGVLLSPWINLNCAWEERKERGKGGLDGGREGGRKNKDISLSFTNDLYTIICFHVTNYRNFQQKSVSLPVPKLLMHQLDLNMLTFWSLWLQLVCSFCFLARLHFLSLGIRFPLPFLRTNLAKNQALGNPHQKCVK